MNSYEEALENTCLCYLDDDEFIEKIEKYGHEMNIPNDGRYPIAFCARANNNRKLIIFNKDDIECLSDIGKDFIIGHEIAHAVDDIDEIGADEWFINFLLEKGYSKQHILYELWYELEIFQDIVRKF